MYAVYTRIDLAVQVLSRQNENKNKTRCLVPTPRYENLEVDYTYIGMRIECAKIPFVNYLDFTLCDVLVYF